MQNKTWYLGPESALMKEEMFHVIYLDILILVLLLHSIVVGILKYCPKEIYFKYRNKRAGEMTQ